MRELDAWIAENVFGNFKVIKVSPRRWDCRYGITPEIKDGVGYGPAFKSESEARAMMLVAGHCKNYTTDPAAAMEVLKKCSTEKRITIAVWRDAGNWYCNNATGGNFYGEADTLELAICLFAKQLFTA